MSHSCPLGPWGWPDENFQSGFWHPKWCRWGPFRIRTARCRYQNPPRRPRKNVRMTQNPQPFWARPPSPLQCGFWVPGSQPANPWQLYILYLQTGEFAPQPIFYCLGEKSWGEVVHCLVGTPKCSANPSNPLCLFHPRERVFRAEDFTHALGWPPRNQGNVHWALLRTASWPHLGPWVTCEILTPEK